jgi:hypothetical protein
MDGMTMDLFADTPDGVQPPARPTNSAPEMDYTPVLEAAFAGSGRKAAMKVLDPERKAALVTAVAVVASAKRNAYDSAVAGESLCSFGWLTRQPALAAATALLHSVFIDSSAIPMAEAKRSA